VNPTGITHQKQNNIKRTISHGNNSKQRMKPMIRKPMIQTREKWKEEIEKTATDDIGK